MLVALIAVWSRRCNFLIIPRRVFIRFDNWMSSMKIIDRRLLVFPISKAIIMVSNPKLKTNPAFQNQELQVETASTIQLIQTFNILLLTPKNKKSPSKILIHHPTAKTHPQPPRNYDNIILCFPSDKN